MITFCSTPSYYCQTVKFCFIQPYYLQPINLFSNTVDAATSAAICPLSKGYKRRKDLDFYASVSKEVIYLPVCSPRSAIFAITVSRWKFSCKLGQL